MLQRDEKLKENRARYALGCKDYTLVRSMVLGGYMVIDTTNRTIVGGESPAFGMTIDDVEAFVVNIGTLSVRSD